MKGRFARVISADYVLLQYVILRAWLKMKDDAETAALWRDWCGRVESSIDALPRRDRDILRYRLDGLRPVDVADIWGCSVKQARDCAKIAFNLFFREFLARG